MLDSMTLREARAVTGSIGAPSKMPGTSYGISAELCVTGSKLAKIPGSTCFNCYAMKGNYLYPSVKAAHARRLEGIANPAWPVAMAIVLLHINDTGMDFKGRAIVRGFHRWHDSGDIQSTAHLAKICAVAELTPSIRHWLPTRELGIVKAYIAQGGTVPTNLVIRVSATMIDGAATKAWPHTSGVHTGWTHYSPLCDVTPPQAQHGKRCTAPENDGACGPCRMCWDPSVPHTTYHKH